MKTVLRTALAIAVTAIATQAVAQVTFYEQANFEGRSFTTERQVGNLRNFGFNDRASSAIVLRDRWEVCEDARFSGRCVVLRAGRYPSLAAMGMNDRVSSVRTIGNNARIADDRYAPPPVAVYDNHRRRGERLFEATVTSVHAVVGPPQQRCWIEHEQVAQQPRTDNRVGGAIAGALLGGILGHQVGGGSGKDLATVGGAVAGGVIGNNMGRNSGQQSQTPVTQDVQRCTTVPGQAAKPEFWDVTYEFNGVSHRVQMTVQPGRTVTVNRDGEPRA